MPGMMSMFTNPMLMMGLGMLGQSGRSRNPTNPAAGAMQGLQMGQQAQTQQQQMLYMQQLMQAKKAEEERKRQQAQMMPQLMGAFMNPDPDMAEETRGQALGGMMGLDPSMAKSILPSMMKPKTIKNPVRIADPNSPTGIRLVSPEDATGQPGPAPRGMVLTTDKDGNVTFQTGVDTSKGGMLAKTFTTKRQEEAFDYGVLKEQLAGIRESYKPEYQKYSGQIQNWLTAGKEKLGGTLSEAETGLLVGFTDFRAKAGQMFAEQLNRMSGAAVTEHEAKRQEIYLPNPKDSPSQFEAKLQSFESFVDMAQARAAYAAKRGIDYSEISLTDMPKVIADRYSTVLDQLEKTLPPEIAAAQAEAQVKTEFGLQ